jgi:hypothetical protein
MADEETNISKLFIADVSVRYIDVAQKTVVKHFFSSAALPLIDAVSVFSAIENMFNEHDIDLHKLAAVSSDGASNFAGAHAGVQALLRKKFVPMHCLCTVEVTRCIWLRSGRLVIARM